MAPVEECTQLVVVMDMEFLDVHMMVVAVVVIDFLDAHILVLVMEFLDVHMLVLAVVVIEACTLVARDILVVVENDKLVVVEMEMEMVMVMGGNKPVMVEVEEVIDELQEKFCE